MKINIKPLAEVEIENIGVYLYEQTNRFDKTDEFLEAIENLKTLLSDNPHMGSRLDNSRLIENHDLRYFPLSGFERYIVIYIPYEEHIDIVWVTHTSRNITNEILKIL